MMSEIEMMRHLIKGFNRDMTLGEFLDMIESRQDDLINEYMSESTFGEILDNMIIKKRRGLL